MNIINKVPFVKEMQIIPVAGYDSMLMTLSGAHSPYFTRNIVILTDSLGNKGLGEIHGGKDITKTLESYRELIIGEQIGNYKQVIDKIRKNGWEAENNNGEGLQGLDLKNLKFVVHAETAIESAMLDLLGKYLGLPVCELLGDGKQRDFIEILGYLFYISDKNEVDLPYLDESNIEDVWYSKRRKVALTPESIVEQALAIKEKYGFNNFKLKGGVLEGEKEIETIKALKKALPEARINIDPNGAWDLNTAIRLCKDMHGILTNVEDPWSRKRIF